MNKLKLLIVATLIYSCLTHVMFEHQYAASTPVGDFDAMVQNAPLNEYGQKVIPYLKYECEQEVMDQIIANVLKENKVPKWRRPMFRNSFMLGCSPKTKQNK
jgi:hypothetical protein